MRVLLLACTLGALAQTQNEHTRHLLEGAFSGVNCPTCVNRPRIGVMIDGYCPVALRDKRELKPGFRQHRAVFWGREYYLADSASLTAFREEPKRYIMGVELRYRTLNMKPQLDGYCPVTLLESATLTVGNVEHLAFFGGRLFYCVSAEARERLLAEREVVAKAQQRYEQLTRERKR